MSSSEEDRAVALDILNNWRSSHSYPINTFQANLRRKVRDVASEALVAQRLKRVPSIIAKLQRFGTMKLARMQDIGGLRAVVRTVRQVQKLRDSFISSRFDHELVSESNYIVAPRDSGYRGIHLIYRYKNRRVKQYEGLLLEIQIRTKLQHAWATAVETMGTFLSQALKASEGPKRWLEFFAVTGSAFASLEKCPPLAQYAHLGETETCEMVRLWSMSLG